MRWPRTLGAARLPTAEAEHKLPSTQQVGGSRRRATAAAPRGTGEATRQVSNRSTNSPSARWLHSQTKAEWRSQRYLGRWAAWMRWRFPHFRTRTIIKRSLLINNPL